MDFSALGGGHQRIHPVPRRSSVSSEPSSKLWFSSFFSFIPVGARLFCSGVLALLLTLPCTYRVGAITFSFSGFQESDVYMVPGSPWTFQSNASCFYFDPPEASWYESVPGRFLYPERVQMKDPVSKQVKSFSTTFIYQIQIQQQAGTSSLAIGPGMSFIVVPDNVTVGAAEDYMGLLTANTSNLAKNDESDNHTLGVELDTFRNPEFHDPNDNHIGVNLASMLSTFIVNPIYPLASVRTDVHIQIWIDYFEADLRVDISIALYGEGKPAKPQGSQTGVDLSLLLENMYIGFSTAKGIKSDNVPYVYAWSFSNDGIPAPPIVIGLDATSASLPADHGAIAARTEVPPTPSHVLISSPLPSGSPPPISMTNPPSPSIGATGPTPTAKKGKSLIRWVIFGLLLVLASVLGICLLCWLVVFRRPLRIFLSHEGVDRGKTFPSKLHKSLTLHRWSSRKFRVKIFFDVGYCREDYNNLARETMKELPRFDVGIVVVTREYFEKKWPMIELIAFVKTQKNDPRNRIRIIPLFYGLTPQELRNHLDEGTWEESWEEMTRGLHPIKVDKCREAVKWLCTKSGIPCDSQREDLDKPYIETVCKEVDKILCEERSFYSSLVWAMTTMVEMVIHMPLICTEKRTWRHANQRAGKEIGVMIYINKLLRLLFAFSGLLILLLSVILDNSFNDKPVRFTAFAILAPIMIFLGFLASGWFPRLPLRIIAFVKRCGFLQHVVPCSPWHDNIVTDYCGEVCSLESLEQEEGTRLFDLPMRVQNFLYNNQISPLRTTSTTYSTFDSKNQDFQVATMEQEGQDLHRLTTRSEMIDFAHLSGILKQSHSEIATSQASTPNLQETPSQVGNIVVNIDHSPLSNTLDNERVPFLEFDGPEINRFPLRIQAFKHTLTKDHTFDLSCTFKNKRTKRMYLTIERLQNLVQNMCQWMENPYPIVVDKSSGILHCMAIEDILWAFTKTVYTIQPVHVKHYFLAGFGQIKFFFILSFVIVSFTLSLIPLISDRKSLYFLFFLSVLVPYLLASRDTNALTFYFIKSLLCPICVKNFGFHRLYKSRSSLRWCNEFRKKKIVNPLYFWIDEEYANTCLDVGSFYVWGFVELPDSPPKDQSFTISCQGWSSGVPSQYDKQHYYTLQVMFASVKLIEDVNCYTNVRLSFFENNYLLGDKKLQRH